LDGKPESKEIGWEGVDWIYCMYFRIGTSGVLL